MYPKLNISNVRLGLATNSSSSHSFIILNDGENVKDDKLEDFSFGWQHFTAASIEAKIKYLTAIIRDSLYGIFSNDRAAQLITANLLGIDMPDNYRITPDDYRITDDNPSSSQWSNPITTPEIDHQSKILLPKNWDETDIDLEFLDDFRDFLLQEKLVILGGNDNEDNTHPLITANRGKVVEIAGLIKDQPCDNIVARKDDPFWVIFNRKTGAKIRFSFEKTPYPYIKSTQPELVDILITTFCDKNCAFCMQDSNTNGIHADFDTIHRIAQCLGEMKVFEVALGGGQPVCHPQFEQILNLFNTQHIVPNFTTKSFDWLRDTKRAIKILDRCGSFAYSVTTKDEVCELASLMRSFEYDKPNAYDDSRKKRKANIHCVIGTIEDNEFEKILDASSFYGIGVTLLGFKNIGRGTKYNKVQTDVWLDTLHKMSKTHNLYHLSIDTALAKEYESQLTSLGMHPAMYHTDEGKFSMYIDAVNLKMGPSSYCDPKNMHSIKKLFANTNLYTDDKKCEKMLQIYKTF